MTEQTRDSQQEHPLVSIGLPVYNEEEHLVRALESLLAQDYPNLEIIISDNASTDRTPQICAEYVERDRRVRYHRNERNVGGLENFNRAFELAQGEFFVWAAGHDVRPPTQVSRCMEILLGDSSIVLCYPQVISVDDEGRHLETIHEYVDTRGVPEKLSRLNIVLWALHRALPIYGVFRTDALKQTTLFTQVVSPDVSLLVELALIGKFAYIPEPPLLLLRPRDFGSWEVYVRKHFKDKISGWTARTLYWRMLRQLSGRVAHHLRTLPGKFLGVTYVTIGLWMNFRWMRHLKTEGRPASDEPKQGLSQEKAVER
jgi:glycosyltransferase involved in cell wall biosynthesis